MKYRKKLFLSGHIYNLPATDQLFVRAIKENLAYHLRHCPEYQEILDSFAFDPHSISGIADLSRIPPLPTSYLKNHTLLSKPYDSLLLKTTSSGTGGQKTLSGFDFGSAACGLFMLLKVFRFHRLISLRPANYIILGYQPDRANQTAMAKALKGVTWLAPAKETAYALKVVKSPAQTAKSLASATLAKRRRASSGPSAARTNAGEYQANTEKAPVNTEKSPANMGGYQLNTEELIQALLKFSEQSQPVRIIGFPAYFKMFIDELNERNIKVTLPRNSKVLLGGGWKTFFAEEISKKELFRMANHTLGIRPENFKDHFSTAEHPINYVACENNHFHVPIFSRVLIRDVNTLEPVPDGTPGLLNLLTPLLTSAPYGSILTDDIAVMKSGDSCGCGISSPYFELLGRVGLASVKTCAQTASEFLKNV